MFYQSFSVLNGAKNLSLRNSILFPHTNQEQPLDNKNAFQKTPAHIFAIN